MTAARDMMEPDNGKQIHNIPELAFIINPFRPEDFSLACPEDRQASESSKLIAEIQLAKKHENHLWHIELKQTGFNFPFEGPELNLLFGPLNSEDKQSLLSCYKLVPSSVYLLPLSQSQSI